MSSRIRRSKRRQQTNLIVNIIFCLMTLTALTICIVLVLQNYGLRNQTKETIAQLQEYEKQQEGYVYTQADVDYMIEEAVTSANENERAAVLAELKEKMSNGGTTADMLRSFFPENIVVYSDAQYYFFPISETLKKHNYVYDNFILQENEEVVYVDDTQEVLSIKGIDVSKYQGNIDWEKVADDGVSYAFIRAGYRGNSNGKLMEDEFFKANIEGAIENNIDTGVYFYTQAVTVEEAIEEAEMVLELIEPYDITYPVVLDLEEVDSDQARTSEMTQQEYTDAAIAFCNRIKDAGYTPMIYGNLKTFMIMLDMNQLEGYDKWFAYYNTPVYFPYEFDIWQYSAKGTVAGIKGDVDMNIQMKKYGGE